MTALIHKNDPWQQHSWMYMTCKYNIPGGVGAFRLTGVALAAAFLATAPLRPFATGAAALPRLDFGSCSKQKSKLFIKFF